MYLDKWRDLILCPDVELHSGVQTKERGTVLFMHQLTPGEAVVLVQRLFYFYA